MNPENHEIAYSELIAGIHFPPIATKAPIKSEIMAALFIPLPP